MVFGLQACESVRLSSCHGMTTRSLILDFSGKFPMLRIPATAEKGRKDRLLPLVPEAARFLLGNRHRTTVRDWCFLSKGRVVDQASLEVVGRTISAIGERARVKVGKSPNNSNRPVKFASGHDLRRSFGDRWSKKVMPPVLKELMRHESIDTTMTYYVGQNADATAELLWATEAKND